MCVCVCVCVCVRVRVCHPRPCALPAPPAFLQNFYTPQQLQCVCALVQRESERKRECMCAYACACACVYVCTRAYVSPNTSCFACPPRFYWSVLHATTAAFIGVFCTLLQLRCVCALVRSVCVCMCVCVLVSPTTKCLPTLPVFNLNVLHATTAAVRVYWWRGGEYVCVCACMYVCVSPKGFIPCLPPGLLF